MGLFDWFFPADKGNKEIDADREIKKTEKEILKSGTAAELKSLLSEEYRFLSKDTIDLKSIEGAEAGVKRKVAELYNEQVGYLKSPSDKKITDKLVGDFYTKNPNGETIGVGVDSYDSAAQQKYDQHLLDRLATMEEKAFLRFNSLAQKFVDKKTELAPEKPEPAAQPVIPTPPDASVRADKPVAEKAR